MIPTVYVLKTYRFQFRDPMAAKSILQYRHISIYNSCHYEIISFIHLPKNLSHRHGKTILTRYRRGHQGTRPSCSQANARMAEDPAKVLPEPGALFRARGLCRQDKREGPTFPIDYFGTFGDLAAGRPDHAAKSRTVDLLFPKRRPDREVSRTHQQRALNSAGTNGTNRVIRAKRNRCPAWNTRSCKFD